MVKTELSQMSFHDCGFNSRNGFDSQISRVLVLSYDRGNNGNRRGRVLPGPIRERADIGSSHPGLPSVSGPAAAARGSFGIDTHSHRSDFCERAVFTIVL